MSRKAPVRTLTDSREILMPKKPVSKPWEVDEERRKFLKSSAAIASGVALSSFPTHAGTRQAASTDKAYDPEAARVTRSQWGRPNLLILITDQERYPQHWPPGWADKYLPNRRRLAKHGLTFTQAFCASAMCTPSRATLFTGLYPSEHGVDQTLRYSTGPNATCQNTLQIRTQNMAKMLEAADYNVQYRGKWHVSKDPSGTGEITKTEHLDIYHFNGWVPPEGGADQNPSGFGGGNTNYDKWYTSHAVDFLKKVSTYSSKPFALIVCLINPHDVMAYPGNPQGTGWDGQLSDVFPGNNYCNVDLSAYPLNLIELPSNITDPQDNKPTAQSQSTEFWNDQLGVISDQLEYVRFYAYLHMVSDKHIGTVLDALESRPALHYNTLVFRFSDHGEMGLSHNMRQKAYNAYEETIHVPLVVSNPRLFPEPAQTSALASLIDLMPTLATIADIPDREKYTFRGTDLTPIILDAINDPTTPSKPVQDSILFTTDENLGSLQVDNNGNPIYVTQPYRIRCLRDEQWKIVMYFDPTDMNNKQFELYDLVSDPLEQYNQAQSNPEQLAIMIEKLSIKMEETHTTPVYDTGTSIL